MKPKDIMKFHKEIKGFDEKEKPSGKTSNKHVDHP